MKTLKAVAKEMNNKKIRCTMLKIDIAIVK